MHPLVPQSVVPCGQEHVEPEHVAPVLQETGAGISQPPTLQVPAACVEAVVAHPAVPHELVGKVQVASALPWQVPAQVPLPAQEPWRAALFTGSTEQDPGDVARSHASHVPVQARLQQ